MGEHGVTAKVGAQLERLEDLGCSVSWHKAGPATDVPVIHTCKVRLPDGRDMLGRGISREEAGREAVRVVERVLD